MSAGELGGAAATAMALAAALGREGSRENGNGERRAVRAGAGALRRALAWLGRTGQGAGEARHASAPRGIRALTPVGHRERRFSSFSRTMVSLTTYFGAVHSLKP